MHMRVKAGEDPGREALDGSSHISIHVKPSL